MSTRYLFLFFAAFGLLFIVLGLRTMADRRRFQRTAIQVPGMVTDLRSHTSSSSSDSGTSVVYHPVLRFTTIDGRIVETESRFGSNPPPARAGAQVPVRYDPANPTDARLTGIRGSGALAGALFVAMGTLFAFIGVVGLVTMLNE